MIPRILLTPGEPAGIGPDLVVALAQESWAAELVAVADPDLLAQRAAQLGLPLRISPFDLKSPAQPHRPGALPVLAVPLKAPVRAGTPDPRNAAYVLETLRTAVAAAQPPLTRASGTTSPSRGEVNDAADIALLASPFLLPLPLRERAGVRGVSALVTGPVQKSTINEAGIAFTGHTEFLAELTGSAQPVMLLVAGKLRVALATTHLALREVPAAITPERLTACLRVLHTDLIRRFRIKRPRILVAGLNPHAGEGGHLGREEIEVIAPVVEQLCTEGLRLTGPLPADTLFTPKYLSEADAVLAMYHDQGLPVLKAQGFGEAVNITLGLPIIRTSVDHGTALDLAGTGRAQSGSLRAAVRMAIELAKAL